jgi:undecaprenyl-diphosphatase
MTTFHALLLGVIQGLTEFLPISSKTHLLFAEQLMKVDPKWRVSFDVLLHLGTTLALVVFFFRRITRIISGLFSSLPETRKENWNLVLAIVIATIPIGITGLLVKEKIDTLFETTTFASVFLIVTGVVLFLTRRTNGVKTRLGKTDALLIGLAQAIAILPGVSRSGMTIAVALFIGFARPEAFEFSFLLSIPAVLGAAVLKLKGTGILHGASPFTGTDIVTGVIVSAVFGLLALYLVKKILLQRRFWYFSFYCWVVGALALVLSLTHPGPR